MWFRCSGGNGSGAGATLTVTYSEDFYGATITATNGSKTLTAVATSSGSVEFKLPEDGTWTVSATVEGQTYSESVLVDTSYNTELLALPNGSTATPVNVIQTWLKCAQIRDKAYTTLSQVLNDMATFEALVSDSNACDYMVRSTNWASGIAADANAMALIGKYNYCIEVLRNNNTWNTAINNSTYASYVPASADTFIPLVPKMTSNTTPSGECSGTSIGATTVDFYKAFDGDNITNWFSASGQITNQRLVYTFPSAVKVKKFKTINSCVNQSYSINLWKNFKIQGSNDGFVNDVHDLYTGIQPQTLQYEQEGILNNEDSYTSYGILCIDNYGGQQIGYLGTLQFYTDVDLTENVLFHSATQDDIYYLDNGSPVIIAHTDDYGYAVVDRDLLPEDEYLTLYSTVAKNPSSLGSPYSRVIHFSKYLTEVRVMPLKEIYWYGYGDAPSVADSNLVISSSYGWTKINGITKNTNNVTIQKPTTIKQYCAARSTNLYNFSGKTIHTIINSSHLTNNAGGNNQYVLAWGEYGGGADIAGIGYIDSSLPHLENVGVAMGVNVNAVVYAIWLE